MWVITRNPKKQPQYFSQIPPQAWQTTASINEGISPLFSLASTGEGFLLLNELLQKQPIYFSQIPVAAWTQNVTAQNFQGMTPLLFLTMTREGCELLIILLEKQPKYFLAIPSDAWGKISSNWKL